MIETQSYSDICATYQESMYPQLWRGLIRLWVPALGNTGQKVRNLAKSSILPYTVAAPSGDTAITAQTLGSLRSNYTGNVGIYFVVGSADIRVTHLGRWKVAGNTNTSTNVYIKEHSTGYILGTVTLNMTTGSNGDYLYGALGNTVILRSGVGYNVIATATNGGDQWYDNDTTVTKSADISSMQSAYNATPAGACNILGTNVSYGPVNFKYVNATPLEADAILSDSGLWSNTKLGSAIKGNAGTGYLAAPGHQLTRYSHEGWFIPVTTASQPILAIAEYPGANTHERSIYLNSSSIPEFYCWDGASKKATGTTVAVAGRPIHIVATYNGTLGQIYVNGKFEGSIAAGNGYTSYSTPECSMLYGYAGSSGYQRSNGYLLKAAVYNRPLSPDEIKILGENPLGLLRRRPRMIYSSDNAPLALRPPQPPAFTESEVLLPISDLAIGSNWSPDGGGTAYSKLDEGKDAHDGYPNTVTCTNSSTPSGELKLGFELPLPNQNITRFTLNIYATINAGDLRATLYVNGSAVPLANRIIVPNNGGGGASAAWAYLDFSGTWFSNDITSLAVGFDIPDVSASGILDSVYLTYGGSCPDSCPNACYTYVVTGGGGEFFGDVYTCYRDGNIWEDAYSTYGDRSCRITCDSVNGWTIEFIDNNIDCTETYISGNFGVTPPTDASLYTCPVGQVGAGCYGQYNLFITSITPQNCRSGTMFFLL